MKNPFKKEPKVKVTEPLPKPSDKYTYVQGPVRKRESPGGKG